MGHDHHGHFVNRMNWNFSPDRHKDDDEEYFLSLEESFFDFSRKLWTNQKFICYNCHYEDFVSDSTAYYYLVFGDFHQNEPVGFECPNCGGPMVGQDR